jgi:hypothetical protein
MQRWQNGSKVLSFNSREDHFSIPVKRDPLYSVDYKHSGKIIRFLIVTVVVFVCVPLQENKPKKKNRMGTRLR